MVESGIERWSAFDCFRRECLAFRAARRELRYTKTMGVQSGSGTRVRCSHFGRVEKIAMKMKFEGIVANWRITHQDSLKVRIKNSHRDDRGRCTNTVIKVKQ